MNLRPTAAKDHLKWDVEHGFIRIVPGMQQGTPIYRHVYPDDIILILAKQNPKAKNSHAYHAFGLYRHGMQVAEFVKAYEALALLQAFKDPPVELATKGHVLLPGISGHTYWATRVREILGAHVSDLGGLDALSEAEKSVLRRASVITIELERLERRFSSFPADTPVTDKDLALYAMLANALRRLLDMTGLQRRTKSITPDLDEYVRTRVDEDPIVDVPDPQQEAAE